MKKPLIYKNNCRIEIIPLVYLDSFMFNRSEAIIKLKEGKEPFLMDAVSDTIKPSCNNRSQDAGDIYQVGLSFRIAYLNSETTNLLQVLKGYGSLLVSYFSSGGEHILLGTDLYPVFLTYNTLNNFDGYEVNLTGTQDIPPLIIAD